MKIVVSKVLNKTDLALSGSHGGLVVTKNSEEKLKAFFEGSGVDRCFTDETDGESYFIHYKDYTSNKSTPNDRITPIGKYATKHGLMPGDILILNKTKDNNESEYMIKYVRHLESVFFTGKSRTTLDVLNFDQLEKILNRCVLAGNATKISETEYEMDAKFEGKMGKLRIVNSNGNFELIISDVMIGENKKYFELDTSVVPFELRKRETWEISYDVNNDEVDANEAVEDSLIAELIDLDDSEGEISYVPIPENKGNMIESKGKVVPSRSRKKAKNALKRANYYCELCRDYSFIRKRSFVRYVEPHHLIPLQYDSLFKYSLDVEANIVALCCNCHKNLHYGAYTQKLIEDLFEKRKSELEAAGLLTLKNGEQLTLDVLLSFYGMERLDG